MPTAETGRVSEMGKGLNLRCSIVIGLLVLALAGCSFEGKRYSPEEVINNAMSKEAERIAYYGEAQLIIEMGEEKEEITVKEWRSKDGRARVELAGTEIAGQVISVNDGEQFITYEEETNQATIMGDITTLSALQSSPKEQALALLEMIGDSHELSLVGEEKIAKRKTYHLKATASKENELMGDMEIWVDKENWLVLKVHVSMGDVKTEVIYTKVDFKPKITDDLFQLDMPDDVEITDFDTLGSTEETDLAGAADFLENEFLYFAETDELAIEKIMKSSFGADDFKLLGVEIVYTKEDVPFLSLHIERSDYLDELDDLYDELDNGEDLENLFGEGNNALQVRGVEGYYLEAEDFQMIDWSEGELLYSVTSIDPSLTKDDLLALTEKMIVRE